MNVAYVLVGAENTSLQTMTWISIETLRKLHPDCFVTVFCDHLSRDAIDNDPRFNLCKIIGVETPPASDMIKSRWVKTQVMSQLNVDTIFLDCDTLLLRPLDKLVAFDGDLLVVAERNIRPSANSKSSKTREFCERMGWPCGDLPVVNSGVWLFRPTIATARLAELWHRRWKQGYAVNATDQPSLHSAIHESGVVPRFVPNCWNALVMHRPRLMRSAHVAHFWRSTAIGGSILEEMVEDCAQTGQLPWKKFEIARASGSPWRTNAESWMYARSGHYFKAVKAKIERCIKLPSGLQVER